MDKAFFDRWMPASGILFVVLLGATTWERDGFWGPFGGYFLIASIVFLAWVLVASGLLASRPPGQQLAEPSPPARTSA
jgi:hypothetical protein